MTTPTYDRFLWIARWIDSPSCENIIAKTEDEARRYARLARGSDPSFLAQECEVYDIIGCGILPRRAGLMTCHCCGGLWFCFRCGGNRQTRAPTVLR